MSNYTIREMADRLTAIRSATDPTKNQFMWDSLTRYADELRSLDWKPIETAPKDRNIILGAPGRSSEGYWYVPQGEYLGDCGGECRCPEYGEPTEEPHWFSLDGGFTQEHPPSHWMDMPPPPPQRS